MRLFVAVDPPAEVRAEIAAWGRRAAAGARPVEAAALHVTVCFLGDQPAARVDEIAAAVTAAARPVGPLGLGAPVWLPRRRPRALAIDLHDETRGLGELADDLDRELGLGQPAARRLRPHVTVARMRAGAVVPGPLEPTPGLVFAPASLTLYRSRLEPDRAVYEVLARVDLSIFGSRIGLADGVPGEGGRGSRP